MKQFKRMKIVFMIMFVLSACSLMINWMLGLKDDRVLKKQQYALQKDMQLVTETEESIVSESDAEPVMLSEYKGLYDQNEDFAGWLRIEDTVIDYPVMQCLEDENYYLTRDFHKEENKNGSLILDNDSNAGVGTKEDAYANGVKPSTNLIIHGHTMKSGQMFGNLKLYQDKEYGLSHNIICFDSLYEKREYELIAVFYSQVYYKSDDVFKYYKFFQADTQEEFDDWYNNIKELSLYDTGVTAEFGDEFITLSCCAYHVQDGRFVVVGKRIKK
jgi:sortase B